MSWATTLETVRDTRGRTGQRPQQRTGPVFDLVRFGSQTAVITADGDLTYADLAGRAADLARDVLGPTRRLVLIEAANHLDALVAYLAVVQHGHVALLVPDQRESQLEQLIAAYDPDVVLRTAGDRWQVSQRRAGTAHDLHPDLVLLLSTSGSTGSPKLVRLSADNLRSNAASIASYLELTHADRAATSLPMHYCYGLSVINSHLAAGAGIVLTDRSVVDDCFWELFDRAGATSFAGVPYTFDLLGSAGFAARTLPTLRYVTQAGGRLAPEQVVAYAEQGRRDGWDFVVMYGQTEATARMAYLPPEIARSRPTAIGQAIPGGELRIEPVPECADGDVGELIYCGPNVMLGYAESPADLSLGRTVSELRTGDLARCADCVFEIVGRRDRQAKLFGLRLDLDHLERLASKRGDQAVVCTQIVPTGHSSAHRIDRPVTCVVEANSLHAFITPGRASATVRERLIEISGLPPSAVQVTQLAELPLTASGKIEYAALRHHARELGRVPDRLPEHPPANTTRLGQREPDVELSPKESPAESAPELLRSDFAVVLGRPDATLDSTFVGLGGDSLSYVELSVRLGQRLGGLPGNWHTRTVAELAEAAPPPPSSGSRTPSNTTPFQHRTLTTRQRRGVTVDVTVVLRAVAIIAIVGTHANLLTVVGGAHILLAVAGYNFARFQLADVPRAERVRSGLVAVARIAVPSMLFIAAVALVSGFYTPATALFLNGLVGSDGWTDQWQFWFLEAITWGFLGLTAMVAIPAVDRLERRAPYLLAATVVAVTLALRFAWIGVEAGPTERYTIGVVAWCFALGWLASRSTTIPEKALVVAAAAVGVLGFFGDLQRELIVLGGITALTCTTGLRVPRPVARVLGVLASSSLFVYLTHWQVYPHLEVDHPLLATLASFAVGIAYWQLMRPLIRRLGGTPSRSKSLMSRVRKRS